VWGADVACVAQSRNTSAKWLEGSPELVIEVRSPCNTTAELHDKAMTALAGAGAIEFWVVDSRTRTVTVYSASSGMRIYQGETSVPLPIAPGSISLKQLFAEITAA
jgi:Uma2 family endonuclease